MLDIRCWILDFFLECALTLFILPLPPPKEDKVRLLTYSQIL